MSFNIITAKEVDNPGAPLLLCQVTAVDGDTVYLSTKPSTGASSISYGGHTYQCRIQSQTIDAITAQSSQGYDIPGSVSLTIADGDLTIWTNHVQPHGWRGATITMVFVIWDVPSNSFSTDAYQWDFIGNKANIDAKGVMTVEAMARASMTRLKVPGIPRQNRCPWVFPQTSSQRAEGLADASSIYFNCGYSPDQGGGVGNFQSGSTPFTTCDYTKASCVARGMFSTDSSARPTFRFGGDTWQSPVQYSGRKYTSQQKVYGYNTPNNAPGQYWNLVYGTQWVSGDVLEPAADPNSLRAEVIVCYAANGPANVLKVLVNGVEVPLYTAGGDVLFRWQYISAGGRQGAINGDAIWDGQGDPHGSLCCIEVVVPSELISSGVPDVQCLVQGEPLAVYTTPSTRTFSYTTNPVWQLLDLLIWGPFKYSQINLQTFIDAAGVCDAPISYVNLTGATVVHQRYRSSFVLAGTQRQALSSAVQALRNNAGLILSRDPVSGLIQCFVEQTLADQQPSPVAGSNYNSPVASKHANGSAANGYYAYLFDGAGSIERDTFKLAGQSINDTPNQVAGPFQDEDNAWQADSFSQTDPDAYVSSGNQQIAAPVSILGISNFDQYTRRANVILSKALRGNARDDAGGTELPEFTTTVKAVHLASRLGAICALTFAQFGLSMVPFRLLSAQPQTDGEHWQIKGHFHSDDWHLDAYGQNPAPFYRNPFLGPPDRPPYPWHPNKGTWPSDPSWAPYYSALALYVNTNITPSSIDIRGGPPVNVIGPGDAPLVPLQATTANTGGSIAPGTYLIAVASSNAGPVAPHFVTAVVPAGTNTNTITVSGIAYTAFVSPTLYIGETSQRMRAADLTSYTFASLDGFGNPTSFTLTAITLDGPGLPDVNFDHFIFLARDIVHGGAWGDAIGSSVGNVLTFPNASWSANQWAGYKLSLYYRAEASVQEALDYTIVSSTANTLTISGVNALLAGDVVVCRIAANHISASTIGDDNLVNSYSLGVGLTANAEIGNLIMIIAGTGAGQPPATIISNTATVFTIAGTWYQTPDASSVYIIVAPSYRYQSETGSVKNTGTARTTSLDGTIKALNYTSGSLLISALTVDANENYSVERFSPIRELYLPASGGSGYAELTPGIDGPGLDGVVRIDLTNGSSQRLVLPVTTLNGAIGGSATSLMVNTVVVNNTACPFVFYWDDGTGEAGTCASISGTLWNISPTTNGHANGAFIAISVTIAAPTGNPSTGDPLYLYFDQPAIGSCPLPTFAGGPGGFASSTSSQISMSGVGSTRTSMVFKFHPNIWALDSFLTGTSII